MKIEEESVGMEWMEKEVSELKVNNQNLDPLYSFEENKPVEMVIDFGNKFESVKIQQFNTLKKRIPIVVDGKKYVWLLNPENPTYRQILEAGMQGQTLFKIMRTGQGNLTRYLIIK